jgi:hypothetical protein
MKIRNLSIAAALVTAVVVSGAAVPAAPTSIAGQELPLKFAMNGQGLAREISGQKRLEITIDQLSTEEDRQALIGALIENGPAAVRAALQKMPVLGRARIPNELSYPLHYARAYQLDDGGWRIVIATDRDIEAWEAIYRPRSVDYDLVIAELRLDAEFKGEGVLAAGVMLGWNPDTNTVIIEDYDTQPLRLKNVRPIGR